MPEKITLNAIKDSDLKKVLEEYSIFKRIIDKEILCKCCNDVISLENFGAIHVKNGKLIIFCNNIECLDLIHGE